MHKRICSLGTLVVLSLLCAPQSSSAQPNAPYGIVSSPQFLDSSSPGLGRLQALGVGSVRIGIDWAMIQSSPGVPFYFGQVDPWINNAHNSGIQVLIGLGGPPSWAAPCEAYCVPYSMTDWSNYVQAVVAHYGTSVTYQVWNEPNDNYFLRSNPGDQGHYAIPFSRFQPILEYAIAARNSSVSSATFVVPDITDAAIGDWFNTFWQHEAAMLAPQDKLSIHVYSNGNIPWDINYLISVTGREVWLTETGPTTPTSDSAQNNFINYLLDTFQTFWDSRWSRFFYYRLWDNGNNGEAILYQNWTPRPAYYTYQSRIPSGGCGSSCGGNPITLAPGRSLSPNQSVTSPNGQYTLVYQSDGNLVEYLTGGGPLWATGTNGTCTGTAIMQSDGNFVIYDCNGTPVWNTGTWGNSGAYLSLRDDGFLVIYDTAGNVIWS